MRRRGRSLIVGFAALSLIAAACGGDDDDSTTDDTEAEADADADATTEEAGDEGGESAGEGGPIWVLLPDSATSDRWEKDDRRFFKEGFEAAGLSEGADFTIVNAEGDATTQISQAEQAIGEGASVIVLTSNDSGSGATIIDLANEAGVQVIEYDRFNTEGSSGGAAYVSFDNVAVGATMASVLEPAIDATGASPARVVMLNGGEEDNNAFLFRDGYNATVEARVADGSWELVDDQFTPGWDNAEALAIMDQILVGAENDVNGVFAANDGIANSVIGSLENAGLDPTTIPVSGQDATTAGIQNVLLGKQAMTVYKPIASEAAVAVQIALALRAGESVTDQTGDFTIIGIDAEGKPTESPDDGVPYVALTPIAVTADNVADTVIADGFRTVEEICTGDVAASDFCQGAGEATGGDEGGDEDAAASGGPIWVLLPDSATSDRWEKDDRRFFKEGFEAAGLSEGDDFTIVNAEGDATTQISQAEQAIGEGASVIVLTSNDSGSGATIIDLANEAGVQVVEYDRFNTEGSSGGAAYVSFDNVRVGATMAEVLEPAIDATGASPARVVMLNGGEEDNNAFLFRDGYNATVETRVADGSWELVADQFTPGWDNAEALALMDQILVGAENDVNGVFAANDGIANSVIGSLENAGLDPTTIPVSGQDATTAGIQNVLLGKQAMTVYKPIASEAAVGVQIALALRSGESVTDQTGDFTIIGIDGEGKPTESPDDGVPYVALVPIAVTADNVADTVIADGFRTVEEICTGDVAETQFCVDNA